MSKAKRPTPDESLMKRTNFFLPEELHQGLKRAKVQRGGSEGEHVRRAVTQYLRRLKLLAL
jgi:hypothetical protein